MPVDYLLMGKPFYKPRIVFNKEPLAMGGMSDFEKVQNEYL